MDSHPIRHLGVRVLTAAAFTAGVGALLLLAGSVENSAQFSRWQPWILLVNICGAVALMVLLTRKLWQLYRDFRDHVPGSRLAMRTVLMFGALVIAPLLIVYLFSLDFINRGIDSWFRVEIKQGLNDAVVLSRSALDLRLREQARRTEILARSLRELQGAALLQRLDEERRATEAKEIIGVRRLRPRRRGQQRHAADAAAGAIAAGSGAAAGRRTQLRQPESARQRPIHHRNRGADPGRGLGARRSTLRADPLRGAAGALGAGRGRAAYVLAVRRSVGGARAAEDQLPADPDAGGAADAAGGDLWGDLLGAAAHATGAGSDRRHARGRQGRSSARACRCRRATRWAFWCIRSTT